MSVSMTPAAVNKVKQIMGPEGSTLQMLRLGVRGGGCSGFQYAMEFEHEKTVMDKEYNFDGLIVLVDSVSATYLEGCTLDYVETLEASGFKFNNPNVKTTCGCGQSFNT